jgi:transcriptional regulator with XRE-family HTH domain
LPEAELEAARQFSLTFRQERYGGVTQRMAEGLGYSQSTLYNFLTGKAGIGFHYLSKLADASGVPIDEILGRATSPGTGEPHPNRTEAVAMAKRLGYGAKAIAATLEHRLPRDLSVRDWLDLVRLRDEEATILGRAGA